MIDVRIQKPRFRSPERITNTVFEEFFSAAMPGKDYVRRQRIRPVYCPTCGTHYTIMKPEEMPWAARVVHLECGECSGRGHRGDSILPKDMEVTR